MKKTLALVLVSILATPTSSLSQTTSSVILGQSGETARGQTIPESNVARWRAVAESLSPNDTVKVTLLDGSTVEGRFRSVVADGLNLRVQRSPIVEEDETISLDRIASIERSRIGTGFKIAIIATGAVLGAFVLWALSNSQ